MLFYLLNKKEKGAEEILVRFSSRERERQGMRWASIEIV